MQSNCFSLYRWFNPIHQELCTTLSPSREIIATLRYRRIEVTKHVCVDGGDWIFFLGTRDKVDTAKRLKLGKVELGNRPPRTATYNLCVLVFVEDIQG